jgi:hypothetical protein
MSLNLNRYVVVPAIISNNKIIPIWDENIIPSNSSVNHYELKNITTVAYYKLQDVLYDIIDKKLLRGIEINSYEQPIYKIGDTVLIPTKAYSRTFSEVQITDITYENIRIIIQLKLV